ncbi:TetR/AcrR family transcriptional regulator [Gallaecimonas xiamenensis]|uniref:TetR family transcriptional regulator n=1 Tax=Gallaecimonas xiamenensis 3-C-1 TaxID=745411 RepID=K2KG31_9GAMM|nr:TetR/AcrR family transcriptional regulator [Gallaecimonas xiamenensis]EKE76290.1 TetR family transcriptional regulator [Gallaecimonas xiamenensis 3-C-1]
MQNIDSQDPISRLLDATETLIYQGGISATGMDAIVKASGVSRKTIYKHFGTKEALVAAALRRRDDKWMAWFEAGLAVFAGPRAQLLGAFEVLAGWFASPDFHGCAFINTAGEVSSPVDPVRQVAKLHKDKLQHSLRLRCQALGAQEPDELAGQLLLLMDGATTHALLSGRASVAVDAQRAAAALLASQGL